jgi:hypothetical protein
MECNVVREVLDLRSGPGDETPEIREALRHCQTCRPCAEAVRSRRVFDDQLTVAIRDVEIPVGLKERLLAAVAPATVSPAPVERSPRRQSRWLPWAACAAMLAVVAGTWSLVAWQRRPRQFDLAAIQRSAGALLERAGDRIDLAELRKFGDAFDLAALREWARDVDLRGFDIDGFRGDDAAAAVVRIGRGPQSTGILLIIPASRVEDANRLASRAGVAYAPVPNAAWKSGDFVFVCFTTSRNREDLERYAMSVPA